jgi:hypothetical protein
MVENRARRINPLCAHPAQRALAGSRAYLKGLPDEEFRSGWANVQSNNYWSSTTYAPNTANAWNVNMNDGNANNNNKNNSNYVWPVRGGEWITPSYQAGPSDRKESLAHATKKDNPDFLFSFENLYRNYLRCRKNKRNTINALRFEVNAEENLFELSGELKSGTYQPSRSVCFIVERPKLRENIAADFRDRVVHHPAGGTTGSDL